MTAAASGHDEPGMPVLEGTDEFQRGFQLAVSRFRFESASGVTNELADEISHPQHNKEKT